MRKWMSLIAASALVLSASVPAQAAPYAAAGVLTIVVGTLPPISIPLATVVDVTGGTLSIPAGAASTSGYFVPVVGFPLGLITGLVVTASNGAGSFSIPAWPTAAATSPAAVSAAAWRSTVSMQVKGALALNCRSRSSAWVAASAWVASRWKALSGRRASPT